MSKYINKNIQSTEEFQRIKIESNYNIFLKNYVVGRQIDPKDPTDAIFLIKPIIGVQGSLKNFKNPPDQRNEIFLDALLGSEDCPQIDRKTLKF